MDAEPFLTTATAAANLIGDPRVAGRWAEPSALDGYTVGGLAGHLARAVLTVDRYLASPTQTAVTTDAAGYFVAVLADHDPLDSEFHSRVRARGEEVADAGFDALIAEFGAARDRLAERLPGLDPDLAITVRDGLVLSVAEYLDTRLVELVLHLDDLAVSIGLDEADGIPREATARVAAVLARIAVERAGGVETLRSLARRERHPEAVRAL